LQDYDNPPLKVDMTFTMYEFMPERKVQVRAAADAEEGGLAGLRGRREMEEERPQRRRSLLDRIIWLFPI
jgi:hypothetical protein